MLATLFPWSLRLFLTAATLVVTIVFSGAAWAPQLSWGLAYAGAVAVSLAGSNWGVVGLVTGGLAALWFLLTLAPIPSRRDNPLTWYAQQLVELLNRQLSHIEAYWIWAAVAVQIGPRLYYQLTGLAALFLLASSIVNGFARRRHPDAAKATGDLHVRRRPTIYVLTMVGLAVIVCRSADAQVIDLLPLAVALSLGTALRALRHRIRTERVRKARPDEQTHVRQFREAQHRMTRHADVGLGSPVTDVAP